MKRRTKRISILVLLAAMFFILCTAVACSSLSARNVDIQFKENPITYRVGDNVDPYDFIVKEKGVTYTITVSYYDTKEEKEITETIYARTFCVKMPGEHTLKVKSDNGREADYKTITFTTKVEEPFFLVSANKMKVYDLGARINIGRIASIVDHYAESATEYEITTDYVEYYQDEEDASPDKYVFEDGQTYFNFNKEGLYCFNLVMTNDGGSMSGTYKVKCEEDLSKITLLHNKISFDKATNIISFEKVSEATNYKIKVGTNFLLTNSNTDTIVDISSLIPKSDFKFFDIIVLPLNNEGEKISKIILDDVVINPDGYGLNDTVVLSKKTTIELDAVTKTVKSATLLGGVVQNFFFEDTSKLVNDYVAFSQPGGYGCNYYIDFEFKGNNLPNVCFFSNDVSGNITNTEGGTGLFAINGLSSYSGGFYCNQLRVYGPNRLSETIWDSGTALQFAYNENKSNQEFPLFSQDGLAINSNKEFKYTIGTFADGEGNIFMDLSLYEKKGGEFVLLTNDKGLPYKIVRATKLTTEDLQAGYIVAYASIKGQNNPTVFKFSIPYYKDSPEAIQNGFVGNNAIVDINGGKYSVELKEDNCFVKYDDAIYPPSAVFLPDAIDVLKNGYVGIKGDYGVGTYLKINFGASEYNGKMRADNMPNVILFSDNLNPGFTSASGKGVLVTPGIDACNMFSQSAFNEAMYIHGPDRISGTGINYSNKNKENGGALGYFLDAYFTQLGLAKVDKGEFTYIIGSFIGENDTVMLDISIYYEVDGKVSAPLTRYLDTGLTEEQLPGGNILLIATNKHGTWNDSTVFAFEVTDRERAIPEKYKTIDSGKVGEDGTVTLLSDNSFVYYEDTQYNYDSKFLPGALALLRNEFVGISNCGVGTYIKINFKPTEYNGKMRGDNIPNVILFADNMNPGFTSVSGKGILVTPGIDACNNMFDASPYNDSMRIFGPNRLSNSANYNKDKASGGYLTKFNYVESTKPGNPLLSQWILSSYSEGEFTYIIGTYLSKNKTVVLDINIYYEVNDKLAKVENQIFDTQLTIEELPGRNIMLVAANKYGTWSSPTIFKYEITDKDHAIPQKYKLKGTADFNGDGSVALAPANFFHEDDISGTLESLQNGYIGLEGNYGVGTYLRIRFKPTTYNNVKRSDNIPTVILFADEINSGLTANSGKGLLVTQGIESCMLGWEERYNAMRIYGPNRMNNGLALPYGAIKSLPATTYPLLAQSSLQTKTMGEFTYILGTYLSANNTVIVDIKMYYVVGDSVDVNQVEFDTNIQASEITGTNIVMMAANRNCVWGTHDNGGNTVFNYTITDKANAVPEELKI